MTDAGTPTTASVRWSVLPAYVGLAVLGLIVSMLTVAVLTEAGGPMQQAKLTGAAVFVLSALPLVLYTLLWAPAEVGDD